MVAAIAAEERAIEINLKKQMMKTTKFDADSLPANFKAYWLFHLSVPSGFTSSYLSAMNVEHYSRIKFTDSWSDQSCLPERSKHASGRG